MASSATSPTSQRRIMQEAISCRTAGRHFVRQRIAFSPLVTSGSVSTSCFSCACVDTSRCCGSASLAGSTWAITGRRRQGTSCTNTTRMFTCGNTCTSTSHPNAEHNHALHLRAQGGAHVSTSQGASAQGMAAQGGGRPGEGAGAGGGVGRGHGRGWRRRAGASTIEVGSGRVVVPRRTAGRHILKRSM